MTSTMKRVAEYTIEVHKSEHPDWKYDARMGDYDGLYDGNNCIGLGDSHQQAMEELLGLYFLHNKEEERN